MLNLFLETKVVTVIVINQLIWGWYISPHKASIFGPLSLGEKGVL